MMFFIVFLVMLLVVFLVLVVMVMMVITVKIIRVVVFDTSVGMQRATRNERAAQYCNTQQP